MRPSTLYFLSILSFIAFDIGLFITCGVSDVVVTRDQQAMDHLTANLGLTDICLSSEARYIRHLALSDKTAPFMDHPGALEHFPSSSFYGVCQ